MTSSYPALRGRFGSTDYYLVTMPVGDLVSRVKFPVEMQEWESTSIEEKYQRSLDLGRIRKEIAPYFSTDPNRFSGSLVLAFMNGEGVEFEDLRKVVDEGSLPKLYYNDTMNMGFLIMSGKEVFVPLDGQHRIKAFEMAIRGHEEKHQSVTIRPNPDLARDQVAVILVPFDRSLSRYIFNKINRYARPTGKADKLITDDDDAVAVITRRLIRDGLIPERLVNIKTNSLNRGAHQFTTLATFNEANLALLSGSRVPCVANPQRMSVQEREKRGDELHREWRALLSGIDGWRQAVGDPTAKGDRTRQDIRERLLLGKPIGQLALVKGYAFACQRDRNADRGLLIKRLNRICWRVADRMWTGILVKPNGRVMSGRPVSNNAARFIAHLIGAKLSRDEVGDILEFQYGGTRGHRLPPPVG